MVAEDLAFLQVDYGLGNLGGVVGDSLDVPCRIDQSEPSADAFRDRSISCFSSLSTER